MSRKITSSAHLSKTVELGKEATHTNYVKTIRLKRVTEEDIGKLLWSIENSFIRKISLHNCLLASEKLNKILDAISKSKNIWALCLDVRGNYYDNESIRILCQAVDKISSLKIHKLNSDDLEKLLQRVRDDKVKLDVLDVSGSSLSDPSLHHLRELIKCRKITTKLNLEDCEGAYRALIANDKDMLNEIYQRNKKISINAELQWQQNLKIKWFRHYNVIKENLGSQATEVTENAEISHQVISNDDSYRTIDSGFSGDCQSEMSFEQNEEMHSPPVKAEPIRTPVQFDLPIKIMSHILFQNDREFSVIIWPNKINRPMDGINFSVGMMEKSGYKIIHPLSEFVAINPENPVCLECTNKADVTFTPPRDNIRDDLRGMTCRNIKFRLDGDCLERIRENGEDIDIVYNIGDSMIPLCVRLKKRVEHNTKESKEINIHIGDSSVSANTYTGRHGTTNSTQKDVTNVANVRDTA
ncbi:uncharacterized protein LOC120336795 [Styela clava]